jgi:hypothetical protein
MKKLLIYLLLIACFECFISATPCLSYKQQKISHVASYIIQASNDAVSKEDINTEIHPLNIFSFRIN